ncbi:hypothetical protein Lal_00040016 [Lupinus albus]|uniref:non-specific serine/threonine protein kinase n=1 Tax=Lupinus albus TaxID=3870 RepID=A0A6A4Q2Z2_LUPAL|nr:putative protein kinase RLK-Pelle-PERK-1 family [Lupinus albus]KAF1862751.1 hypothetical protein Lal_00040016 [Lupinus albus]
MAHKKEKNDSENDTKSDSIKDTKSDSKNDIDKFLPSKATSDIPKKHLFNINNDSFPTPKPILHHHHSLSPKSAPLLSPPPPPSLPPSSPPSSPPLPSSPPPPLPASPPPPQLSPPPPQLSPPPPQLPPPPPPPKFQAPPPPSSSPPPSPPSRNGAPSNDSSTSKSPISPLPIPSGSNNHTMHGGGGSHAKSGGGGGGGGSSSSSSSSSNDSSSSSSTPSDDNSPGKYVGYTLAGVFVIGVVALALFYTYKRSKRKTTSKGDSLVATYDIDIHAKSGTDVQYKAQQPQSVHGNIYGNGSMKHIGGGSLDTAQPKSAQIAFTYDMVMEMTNAFCSENVIGEGGFGCVYKGWLHDGRAVAVKQLKAGSGQGEREFQAEVEIISRVHHKHLVSLVGYCIFEQQRMLIYEFLPNGTLHHHLHGSEMPVLDWSKRLKIAIGAAKGLAYLHEDCSQKIIHRDIKSANILLDDAFEAQVADFGLARLTDTGNTHVSTRVMGTFGYMAPEYATSGKLTDRSDVFSFGVVLLELITGRKPVDQTQPLGDESLVEWARPLLIRAIETRDISELTDPRLEKHYVESEMFRMIEAAAACVRHSTPKRPRMVQVVRALDSGDDISDLTNGVKYGQSTVYDSRQYDKDIMLFRRMANDSFVDTNSDMYCREYGYSRDMSGIQPAWLRSGSSGESESNAFNSQRSSS